MNELSEKMIKYRAKNHLSQSGLAKLCGISTQTVNHIENGLQEPTKLTKAKICMVIDGEKKEG